MKPCSSTATVVLIFLLCVGCHNGRKKRCSDTMVQSNKSYMQVSAELNKISSRYKEGYIEFPFTLEDDVLFNNILDSPCEYKPFLITALKDSSKGKVYKLIALYELQHLCIDDYLEILKIVFAAYRNKSVDEAFLMAAIDQEGFSLEVCKNYSNEQLRQLLQTILPTIETQNNKNYLNDIISGNNWKGRKEGLRGSGERTPWVCD
jgi:hypothetical protein